MGWFSSLFRKKEALNFASLKELEKYFSDFTKPVIEQTEEKRRTLSEEFKQKISELKEEIEELKRAELRNPNIEEKLKDFMAGNRNNYISQLNFFINQLPEFNNNFCERFNESLAIFVEKTRKSNLILREFFEHEVRNVSAKIAELARIVESLKTVDKKAGKSNLILRKIKEHDKKSDELFELNKKSLQQDISHNEKVFNEYNQEKENLEKSEDYKKYLKLLEGEKESLEEVKKVKETILNYVASVSRVLKKYERVALKHQGLIHGYLKSTVDTFLLDKEDKIIEILEKASKIELNDKDKSKLEKNIGAFNEKKLNNLRKDCLEKEKTHNDLSGKVKEEKINKKLKELNESINKLQEKIEELKKEAEKCNNRKEQLERELKESLSDIKRDIEEYCHIRTSISENNKL